LVTADGQPMTKFQFGEELNSALTTRIEKMTEPFRNLYNEIRAAGQEVPLSVAESGVSPKAIATHLLKIGSSHLDKTTAPYKWLQQSAESLRGITNVGDLQKWKTLRINAA